MGGEQVGGREEGRRVKCLASWRRIRMSGGGVGGVAIMVCGS